MPATTSAAPRRRDAAKTRRHLLDAALRRFAHDGYAVTTVREIADDAGVNVALINRYFQSKEGLFEACLEEAADELSRAAGTVSGPSRIPDAIRHVISAISEGRPNDVLLLLLRSSGDERTERMRVGLLRTYGENLAASSGDPGDDRLLVRAQLVLALTIGIATLRSATALDPLASATEQELAGPLREVVDTLLPNRHVTEENLDH
ncbi:TetR/AcrR family transcriptional regulator [Nonomuraea insulae]|uniref:TetR/AcrR family transcriptional regulator n=1 Tax=Nonomuraea insulae TaxID=1616787 RepID=A0ABW1CUJ7_9ACTN